MLCNVFGLLPHIQIDCKNIMVYEPTQPTFSCFGWNQEIFIGERWRRLLAMTIPAAIGGLAEELQFQAVMWW